MPLRVFLSQDSFSICSEGRTNLVGIGAGGDLDEGPPRPVTILSIDGSSSTVNVRSSSSNILEDGQMTGRSSR